MDIQNIVERKYKVNEHDFYCDKCNKHLGKSVECDDGYYKKLGEFELDFLVGDWYKIKKHFCDDCRIEFINNLIKTLTKMGFMKD